MPDGSLTTYERPVTTAPAAGTTATSGSVTHAFKLVVKRAIDLVGASIVLVCLLPFMLAIAFTIQLQGGKPLFQHRRMGRDGRSFGCMKFRTMVTDADAVLARHLADHPDAAEEWATRRKLACDPRVTKLGAFLRATSLDELPQLINVLRGEMSLVGPRPVVRAELDAYYGPARSHAYTAVRPGITGLWQISGRSDTSYAQRVELDTRYVREWSLFLDIKILLATVPVVLARRGAT